MSPSSRPGLVDNCAAGHRFIDLFHALAYIGGALIASSILEAFGLWEKVARLFF